LHTLRFCLTAICIARDAPCDSVSTEISQHHDFFKVVVVVVVVEKTNVSKKQQREREREREQLTHLYRRLHVRLLLHGGSNIKMENRQVSFPHSVFSSFPPLSISNRQNATVSLVLIFFLFFFSFSLHASFVQAVARRGKSRSSCSSTSRSSSS
jgi:hypothetical protein